MSPTPTGEVRRTAAGRDLVLTRELPGSLEDAWASLTESERTGRWYASWTGDGRVGGIIELTLVAEEGSPTAPATIEVCEPPTRLALRTGDAGGSWSLEVRLEPLGPDRTRLTFLHHLAEGDRAQELGPGWEYYLDRLLSAVGHRSMPDFDDYWPSLGAGYAEQDRLVSDGQPPAH
ncbi:hypothetical protein GCM10022204_17980 [Microlunatus aurantiacus]|uniref:Activator of Hsp90 ATPase homologue 1/2-like C-terminal domain-containing protein n=1 Tax=Microlunatus aurantiacus TaxID=446786 RepID=A0ABP7D709_9ACTN